MQTVCKWLHSASNTLKVKVWWVKGHDTANTKAKFTAPLQGLIVDELRIHEKQE